MARSKTQTPSKSKSKSKKPRTPPAGRVARPIPSRRPVRAAPPERDRNPTEGVEASVLRVWRRVLERRLKTRLRAKVAVEVHDNTHTMVTFQRQRGLWRLRLHHMFLAAPDEILTALAEFIRVGDPESSARLDRYIAEKKALIRRVSAAQLRKRLRIDPSGEHHDLLHIFSRLNRRYFRNRISATITYGPAPRVRGPRKSIKMGSYSADSKVIRIHPALDQRVVPRYFVEWIVFHEMLHHVHRARKLEDGRRCVHTPEFVAHERKFHAFRRAQRWENENLDLLLDS
jgi:hypothetical protein